MSATAAGPRESFHRTPQPRHAASVGPREMVAVAFKHRWKVLLAFLLPPLLAAGLALVLPKVYRAHSDILVKTGREYLAQTEGGSAMSAPSSTKQEEINSEIALLTSRAVAESSIAAAGLANLYPDLLIDPPSSGSVLDAAVEKFEHDFSVEPLKLSNIIEISFDAPSPEWAQAVLDQVVKTYIAKHTQVFAGSRAEGYQDSIRQALDEIGALEQRRSALKLESGIYDIAAQRQALIGQRVTAQANLQDALTRQAKLAGRLEFLVAQRPNIAATTVSANTDRSDDSDHAREALTDLRQTEASLALRYGPAHPELLRVRSQIEAVQRKVAATSPQRTNVATTPSPLRQQIEQEIVLDRAELTTLGPEVERDRTLVAHLDGELTRLERADLELRNTVLRIDVLTDNLRSIQGRYEQARTQEQTELARQVSVVQVAPAIAAEKPVKPRKLIFAAAGLLGGVLLAGAVAVAAVLLNKTVLTEDAAERLLGLPVLAVVPVRDGPATLNLE